MLILERAYGVDARQARGRVLMLVLGERATDVGTRGAGWASWLERLAPSEARAPWG